MCEGQLLDGPEDVLTYGCLNRRYIRSPVWRTVVSSLALVIEVLVLLSVE